MKRLLLATAAALLLSVPAHATLIQRDVLIKVTSFVDDQGHDCHANCGKGDLAWSFDPADLLHTFDYTLNTQGVLDLSDFHGGSGFLSGACLPDPSCGVFDNFGDAAAFLLTPQGEHAIVGTFLGEARFGLDVITNQLTGGASGVDGISIDRFGHGEWAGQDQDGQAFRATFSVPEPSTLSDLLAGFFLVLGFGALTRRANAARI
jgi:hypothetical protein